MVLTIQIPNTYEPERRYILSVLMKEFLGLDIQIQVTNRKGVFITQDDHRQLFIPDGLFNTSSEQWLQPVSLPQQPLKVWNLASTPLRLTTVEPQIPVIYGNDPGNPDFFRRSESEIYLGLDIFGAAFFMLTRYEEVIKPERDQHDRFPATASLAYQEGFLDRPIINEYLEILWACLKHLWPGLKRKPRQFQTYVSHDVDEPFMFAFTGVSRLVKRCGGDLLKRRSLMKAVKSISSCIQVKAGNPQADPCNTFEMIMDISEQHNLKSAFYFITDHSAGQIDGVYSIFHPLIRNLLKRIAERGHEIGLHASFNSYNDSVQTKKEFDLLKKVCTEEFIEQRCWGGRQHFLRWETPITWQNLEDAGLDYDTTLSFADRIGFRCGVCYEFSVFDVIAKEKLKLRERPLTVMEATVMREKYMNIDVKSEEAFQAITKIKGYCSLFKGDFRLLWHNSRLVEENDIRLYRQVLKY